MKPAHIENGQHDPHSPVHSECHSEIAAAIVAFCLLAVGAWTVWVGMEFIVDITTDLQRSSPYQFMGYMTNSADFPMDIRSDYAKPRAHAEVKQHLPSEDKNHYAINQTQTRLGNHRCHRNI